MAIWKSLGLLETADKSSFTS